MKPSVIIVAVHDDRGTVLPATWGLLAAARRIGGRQTIAVLEKAGGSLAADLARTTGTAVLTIQDRALSTGHPERHCEALVSLLQGNPFTHLLLSHDASGIDLAPQLALRMEAACISGVAAISSGEDRLQFTRPVMGGKLGATVESRLPQTVLTLLPGAFGGKPPPPVENPGRVTTRPMPACEEKIHIIEELPGETPAAGIADARVIVAAGNGSGSEEGLDPIRELADLFPRSAIAGSRPVCDRGWLPYNRQVGVTGASVSPELYIACGISGAYQHVAAMQGSGFVVAINRDVAAPMCRCADLCVIEDLNDFVPALLACAEND